MELTIKELLLNEEYFQVIELQKVVWRLSNYDDCIPNHIFKAVAEIGGLVLGVYSQKKLVGFLMAMPGQDESGIFHHSHILGVHPDFAHKNIGYLLKKRHYEKARKQDISKVTWTYDPLQGPNANLNISKLGSIVRNYKVNYYGEVMGESELVSGLPSDRFWVEWYIQTNHVKDRMQNKTRQIELKKFKLVNEVKTDKNNLQKTVGFSKPESEKIAIEIPLDFQGIYDKDKNLANDWRLQTRELFLTCFYKGYTVVDFFHQAGKGNFYLLHKDFQIE